MSDLFGEARSLLARGPESWEAVRALVHTCWEEGALPEGLVPYCAAAFQAWPASFQREPLPAWVDAVYRAQVPAPVMMCNELILFHQRLDDDGAQALASSPYVSNLRALFLDTRSVSARGLQAIARSPHLRALRRLHLTGVLLGYEGAQVLAPLVSRLDALGVAGAELRNPSLMWPEPSALSLLDLRINPLGVQGLEQVLGSENLPGVRELCVSNCQIGDASPLLRGSVTSGLTSLDLRYNPLGETCAALGRSDLSSLQVLGLGETGAGAAMWRGLAGAPWLGGLRELLITNEHRDIMALVRDPALHGLTRLNLHDDGLTGEDVGVLAPGWLDLEVLVLSMNPIGDQGARALARAPTRSLHTVLMHACQLGDGGVEALAQAQAMRGVRRLLLSNNLITERGVRSIASLIERGSLRDIALGDNLLELNEQTWLKSVGEAHGCVVRV